MATHVRPQPMFKTKISQVREGRTASFNVLYCDSPAKVRLGIRGAFPSVLPTAESQEEPLPQLQCCSVGSLCTWLFGFGGCQIHIDCLVCNRQTGQSHLYSLYLLVLV